MNSSIPIYAPLKDIDADLQRIRSEIETIPSDLFYDQSVWRKNPSEYESIDGHLIGSTEDNQTSDYFTIDENGINHIHKGYKRNWRCVRLTEVKDEPYSLTQNTIKRDGKWIRFREEYPAWSFRTEMDQYLPYTLSCIKSLPVEAFSIVRVLILDKGDFGPIHIDEGSKNFYTRNITSINFNVADGGQPLRVFVNDKVIDINDPFYQVNNGYPHGVETVNSRRITITVESRVSDAFLNYLDLSKAVWS